MTLLPSTPLGRTLPLTLLALALAPALALAQGPGMPAPPGKMPPEVQEAMRLQVTLGQLQKQAMGHRDIAKQREALQAKIEAAMKASDPKIGPDLERFRAIGGQLEAARAAKDNNKANELLLQAQELGKRLQPAQAKVFATNEGVRKAAGALDHAVQAKMAEINPKAPELIKRFEVLAKKLQSMRPGPRMPPPKRD